MNELVKELKDEIIEALNLEEMTADDIDENEPLFGEGLGLDSIDALELIVLLEKKYGIKLADPAEGKKNLHQCGFYCRLCQQEPKEIKLLCG